MSDYALYYWPVPFRGHFVRYVLARAGARWDEPSAGALLALKDAAAQDQPYPFMAPPLLHDLGRDRWLSQMPAIVTYLARKHDLPGDPDEGLRLVADACDILLEITRHHGEQLWYRAAWQDFTTARLPRWMQIHEALVRRGGFDADNPGLAELALAALWHTMVVSLPPLRPLLSTHAPTVEALADHVAALPPIAAMLAEWQGKGETYCGGQIEASIRAMLKDGG